MNRVNLIRRVADIYIPPVTVIDDKEAMNQLMALHFEQKQFFNALVTDDVCHEDVLEFIEAYVDTRAMDDRINQIEQQLTELAGDDG